MATNDEIPPRRRRKDARPAEIIEAGLAAFAEHGFAGTSMAAIARRAGIAKGTIYRYFDDKEALFLAAVRLRVSPMLDTLPALIDAYPGSTRDLLATLVTTVHARLVASDAPVLMRIIIAEGHRFPTLTALYHREGIARGRAILQKVIARGIARGEVRPGPAAGLPLVIMGPAIMAALWRLTFQHHDPIPPEDFLAAHIDLIQNGVCI